MTFETISRNLEKILLEPEAEMEDGRSLLKYANLTTYDMPRPISVPCCNRVGGATAEHQPMRMIDEEGEGEAAVDSGQYLVPRKTSLKKWPKKKEAVEHIYLETLAN